MAAAGSGGGGGGGGGSGDGSSRTGGPPGWEDIHAKGWEKVKVGTRWKLFIGGEFVDPVRKGTFAVVDPVTEDVAVDCPAATLEDVEKAVNAANAALPGWRARTGAERAVVLRAIAEAVAANKELLAITDALNVGKPLAEAEWDVDDVVTCFNYCAGLAEGLDKKQGTVVDLGSEEFKAELFYESVGVVGAITPFNYPLLMATWKVASALAAGCTVVLKPSELTPISVLQLAQITTTLTGSAALPAGAFNVLTGLGLDAGAPLVAHPGVRKISFTGSGATGKRIGTSCISTMKRVSLELGGKSAAILFDDVSDEDLLKTAEWVLFGCMWTNGQICSATARLLVQSSIADKFLDVLTKVAAGIHMGPPLDPESRLGPVVSKAQYEKVMRFIDSGRAQGARLLFGGTRPSEFPRGFYVKPTIFVDVQPHMDIWREEIFGPVLCVRTFSDQADAIAQANASPFGLAAAVFSGTPRPELNRALDVGIVWNQCSQPCFCQVPWGGTKASGLGRDNGEEGFKGYLETKQVITKVDGEPLGWYPMPARL